MIQDVCLTEIYCKIDEFLKEFDKFLNNRSISLDNESKRKRTPTMNTSEILTILVIFHLSNQKCLKLFYLGYVKQHLKAEFPKTVSYNRFVELQQSTILPMIFYMLKCGTGNCTGISFIDSTPLKVCHNRRIHQHKVFSGLAERGKSSTGFFFGFKLHLVINDKGEILNFLLTRGNVDDREPMKDKNFMQMIFGKLFGDKGYISKEIRNLLFVDGINLITKLRKNMKGQVLSNVDKILLRKRSLIETVNDELKNICQIEHSRHRSFKNFFANLMSGLIAYSFLPKKPSLNLTEMYEESFQPALF